MFLPVLEISYKWTHTVSVPLCWDYFTWHKMLKFHPGCSGYHWTIFYCVCVYVYIYTQCIYVNIHICCCLVTSCVWLFCNPVDCSLPGFSIHGIFQARILEWVAISFSRRSSGPRDWTQVSQIAGRLFTVWVTRESELVLYSEVKVFSWWKLLTLGLLNSENKSSE